MYRTHLPYKFSSIFRLLTFLVLATVWSGSAAGQGTPTYAYQGGASSNAFPFATTSSNRIQNLYLANQFLPSVSAGNITDVYYKVNSAASNANYTNVSISLGMTSLTGLTSGPWNAGLTQVYTNPSFTVISAATGTWVRFTLQTPFYWDGISNLLINTQNQGMTGTGFTVCNASVGYTARMYGPNAAASSSGADASLAGIGFDMAPAGPCTSPPTPGTAVASATNVCQGVGFSLSLTGSSLGLGQTYQWQSAPSSTGPWTNVGPSANSSFFANTATTTLYYRAAVTCGASTAYSTSVLVTVPALFPGGTYTINSALPTAGSNFQTYGAAVSAISCGIAASCIFNVAPGSGPYNEQVSIPAINTNATRTVTFNGNNTTLTYTNTTNATNYAVLRLDGADYFTFKKLTVIPGSAGSYGYGICITNNADYNLIDSCTVDNGLTQTSSNFAGVIVGGSSTSATSSTLPCDSNIVSNCDIIGGYYCTTMVGVSSSLQQYNQFINNKIHDYYVYGMYLLYNNNHQIVGNELHRSNRTSVSTFYGIVNTSGNLKGNFSKNRLHNPFGAVPTNTGTGYFLYNGASATVGNENVWSNNIVYNMDGNGTHYIMYSVANSSKWYFNTISADYTAATAGTSYGYYQASSYTGIDFKNNIISMTRGGSAAKYAVYHASSGYATTMDKNDYYVSGTNAYMGYNGTTQITLANWQTATAKDPASMSVNPQFTAPLTGDLTPSNLAMDNIGTPIAGIPTDIINYFRNVTTPDAGAFEFNNPCFTPSGLTATGITVTTANLSWNAISGLGYEYVVTTSPTPPASGTFITTNGLLASSLNSGTLYYLHVRNRCALTTYSPWVSISFTTCTQAVITPLSSVIFCAGGSVTLTANPGSSYQWKLNGNNIVGATTSSYNTSTPGSYTVQITTAATGCISTSVPVVVQVGTPPATINPSGALSICPGSPATLNALSGVGLTYQWMLNGTPITGATSSSYVTSTPGSYTVFISSGPNCNATTVTPTVISMYPITPASIATPPFSAVCPGSTITLNANNGNNLTYQWKLNGTDIPGATSAAYTGNAAGTYIVVVTSTLTGCSSSSAPMVIGAAVAPPAAINAPGQITGCDSVVLTANSGPGYTYQWVRNGINILGATSQTYGAPSAGNYSVKVTNSGGCTTTSSTIAATVNPSPNGVITYSAPLIFCQGSAVVLNTQEVPGQLYQWLRNGLPIPGASSSSYTASLGGSYALSLTNNFGCSKITPTVVVVVHPLPVPPISFSNDSLFTGNYNVYQWFFNNQAIGGANYRVYMPTQKGAYSVMVTDANGCTNTSDIYFVNSLGIGNLAAASTGIKVYPNPASSQVTITNEGQLSIQDISILNSIGALVHQQSADGNRQLTVRTAQLPAGIYTLRIRTSGGLVIRKLELIH